MKYPGDGIATIKRRRHDIHDDDVRDSATVSGRGRLIRGVESIYLAIVESTKRRRSAILYTYHKYRFLGFLSGDENPIHTLGDYSKPSHKGYRNCIELPVRNNMVPLRSDIIRLVQNGCSFHELRSEDPNQHLKDFLKLVDSLDLDGSITTWEDLTTHFLAQFFPPGRTAKLHNYILMFQQHHRESLFEAWTSFKDLLRTIDQSAGGKLRDQNTEESWALLKDLSHYDNKSWNDPRDFTKPVKAIGFPQDVPSTSDRRLIELENQIQRLMEAHLALMQPTQVNKITTSCEICSGPHDTQCCMEDFDQAFIEYASSRTDEARDPQCSTHIHGLINTTTMNPKQQSDSNDDKAKENEEEEKDNPKNIHVNPSTPADPSISFITKKVLKLNSFFESLVLIPQSSKTELVCTKGDDDIFTEEWPSNLKISCNIGHVHVEKSLH
ncbi:MAK10-like protein [Tanacetum coccineum]